MLYGYHRTSTKEQHLDRGITQITDYCEKNNLKLEKIFTDQQTGKNFNRPRYTILKEDVLRKGDTLIVTEVDRLGRNKQSTLKELRYFQEHEIRIMILELPTTLMDTSIMEDSLAQMMLEAVNNVLIEIYAAMAQAEVEKKEKQQRDGIQAKKDRGDWADYGRPHVIEFEKFSNAFKSVEDGKIKPVELMRQLDMKKSTFYKYRKLYLNQKK